MYCQGKGVKKTLSELPAPDPVVIEMGFEFVEIFYGTNNYRNPNEWIIQFYKACLYFYDLCQYNVSIVLVIIWS